MDTPEAKEAVKMTTVKFLVTVNLNLNNKDDGYYDSIRQEMRTDLPYVQECVKQAIEEELPEILLGASKEDSIKVEVVE